MKALLILIGIFYLSSCEGPYHYTAYNNQQGLNANAAKEARVSAEAATIYHITKQCYPKKPIILEQLIETTTYPDYNITQVSIQSLYDCEKKGSK